MSTQPSRFPALTYELVEALFQARNAAALLARLNHRTITDTPIDADQIAAVAGYVARALEGVIDAVTE